MNGMRRIREYMEGHGAGYTLRRLWQKASQRYFGTYDRVRKKEICPEEELARQRENQPEGGLISVVIPVYNTDPRMLRELLDCLRAQTYRNFEVILYDGCSTREETREALREAERGPDGASGVFRVVWGKENRGISGNTNAAAALAAGEYAALADHDDLLTPDALWRVAECIARERAAGRAPDLIYTDEDRVTENSRSHMDPHYKAEFCPDTLCSDNYICHLAVIRKALLEETGGLRSGFDGSQDHDLMLRVTEKARKICHVPYTLYSWRENSASMSHTDLQKCLESGCRAAEEHEARLGRKVTAEPVHKAIRLRYEIPEDAVVDAVIHGETEEACAVCFALLREESGWQKLREHFAVSAPEERIRAVNRAAAECSLGGSDLAGSNRYLLVLDAAARKFSRGFVEELLMYAQRADVAGVTPVLVDRRGRITHGGFALGMDGGAQCVNEGLHHGAGGWHDTMNKAHNVSAVSLGCFLVRRDNWIPLDEGYASGLVMADLGLRQRERGKWFVYTPHAAARMDRRALLLSGGKRGTEADTDLALLESRWGRISDPCYSSRFSRKKANYSVK